MYDALEQAVEQQKKGMQMVVGVNRWSLARSPLAHCIPIVRDRSREQDRIQPKPRHTISGIRETLIYKAHQRFPDKIS